MPKRREAAARLLRELCKLLVRCASLTTVTIYLQHQIGEGIIERCQNSFVALPETSFNLASSTLSVLLMAQSSNSPVCFQANLIEFWF